MVFWKSLWILLSFMKWKIFKISPPWNCHHPTYFHPASSLPLKNKLCTSKFGLSNYDIIMIQVWHNYVSLNKNSVYKSVLLNSPVFSPNMALDLMISFARCSYHSIHPPVQHLLTDFATKCGDLFQYFRINNTCWNTCTPNL